MNFEVVYWDDEHPAVSLLVVNFICKFVLEFVSWPNVSWLVFFYPPHSLDLRPPFFCLSQSLTWGGKKVFGLPYDLVD